MAWFKGPPLQGGNGVFVNGGHEVGFDTCSLWGSAISFLAGRVCQVELRMSDCLGTVRAEGWGGMVVGVVVEAIGAAMTRRLRFKRCPGLSS